MPSVTVVIPTYNRARMLPRAIESVLNQTYEDVELLVVDDGSDDRTPEVLSSYDDARLRVETHETNRGANAARNMGIVEAEGEYVAFLDSDDTWHPEKLERQLDRLDAAGDACVAVYCDFERATDGATDRVLSAVASILERFDAETPTEGGEELAGAILADELHSGAGSTLLVETAVARRVDGFDENLDRFQDPEFLLRVVHAGDLAYVDEPLVTRHDTGSPSPETVELADRYFLAKHDSLVADLEAAGYRIWGAHALVLAKGYLEAGAFLDGAHYLQRSAAPPRHWPGVLWCALTGLRTNRRARLVAAVAAVGLLVGFRHSRSERDRLADE